MPLILVPGGTKYSEHLDPMSILAVLSSWDFECLIKLRQKYLSLIVCLILPLRSFLSTSCGQQAPELWISRAEMNREAGGENYFPLLLERRLAFHIFILGCAVWFQWLAALAGDTASDSCGWMAHFSGSNFCWRKAGQTTRFGKGLCGRGSYQTDLLVWESVKTSLE